MKLSSGLNTCAVSHSFILITWAAEPDRTLSSGQPGRHSKFQTSQDSTVKPYLTISRKITTFLNIYNTNAEAY